MSKPIIQQIPKPAASTATMVEPTGVPATMEIRIPRAAQNTEITAEQTVTVKKASKQMHGGQGREDDQGGNQQRAYQIHGQHDDHGEDFVVKQHEEHTSPVRIGVKRPAFPRIIKTTGPFPNGEVLLFNEIPMAAGDYFSNSLATSFRSVRMGRCWGQIFSHLPHSRQSDALPWSRVRILP